MNNFTKFLWVVSIVMALITGGVFVAVGGNAFNQAVSDFCESVAE
jgi:hypothetical protein